MVVQQTGSKDTNASCKYKRKCKNSAMLKTDNCRNEISGSAKQRSLVIRIDHFDILMFNRVTFIRENSGSISAQGNFLCRFD